MIDIEYSPLSLEDLQHHREYIVDNWGEPVAKKIIKKIISDIKNLEQYPLLGVSLASRIDVPTDYRYLFTEKNYVFYRLGQDKIRIVRIINEQEDYIIKLFGNK